MGSARIATAQGALAAPLFIRPVTKGIVRKVQDSLVDPRIALHLGYMEAELAKAPWFGGEAFSAADIQTSFPLEAAAARGGLDGGRPKLRACLHARLACQRALARGGDYRLG